MSSVVSTTYEVTSKLKESNNKFNINLVKHQCDVGNYEKMLYSEKSNNLRHESFRRKLYYTFKADKMRKK